MEQASAWVLQLNANLKLAIGWRELVQLIDSFETFTVPTTPTYCSEVIFWQQRLVPVLDLARRMGQAPQRTPLLALLAFPCRHTQQVQLGAVYLPLAPKKVSVTDAMAGTPTAAQIATWGQFVHACFELDGDIVPILNLARVFGTAEGNSAQPPLYLQKMVA